MNVYDFDKTIYDGDSSLDFYKFSLKKYPSLIKYWPRQAKAAIKYKRNRITKTDMKTVFYDFFKVIPNMDVHLNAFWEEHEKNIKMWYLEQKRNDDLIVSASPEFLLRPICDKLGVELIASIVDPKNGNNLRQNCFGAEKVRRMKEKYRMEEMEEFYSDSYSDDPLAQYATESFYVKGDMLLPW